MTSTFISATVSLLTTSTQPIIPNRTGDKQCAFSPLPIVWALSYSRKVLVQLQTGRRSAEIKEHTDRIRIRHPGNLRHSRRHKLPCMPADDLPKAAFTLQLSELSTATTFTAFRRTGNIIWVLDHLWSNGK